MSEWVSIKASREYLGKMDEKGVYIRLPGDTVKGWYIIVPTKLVRVDESNDWFEFATRPSFDYITVQFDEKNAEREFNKCNGAYVIEAFAKENAKFSAE
ncbi:MAG: hypothetical protein PUF17_07390 [Lactimicrobium massiliense]|nr:hypothetical protein [Lactimicrobium massiliense]MDD6560779.1 hypothetical protein [Lactimicrobium massiliense]